MRKILIGKNFVKRSSSMKRFLLILIFCSLYVSAGQNPNKYVIGVWPYGLGSAFFAVLNHLAYCDTYNKIPVIHWDHRSLYYTPQGFNGSHNVWEYYFEPLSSLKYEKGDRINSSYSVGSYMTFFTSKITKQDREHASQLINKYVRIKPVVQNKINEFYDKNMKGVRTIGIHLRGTNKYTEGVKQVSPEQIVTKALEYYSEGMQFLIASDEQALFDRMKNILELQNKKVIYYDCYRSANHQPLVGKPPRPSPGQLGEDVLVEISLLARCNYLVHTYSNVSTMILYFNPDLENGRIII